MSSGRLEAQITVPSGGWGGTIDDSGAGAAVAWSVPAGTYFFLELISELQARLNTAAPTDTITVTAGTGEGGTGKVTIASTGTTAIVWVAIDLRDLLGFTGNLSGASSYLATKQARSIWHAGGCPYLAPNEIYPWGGWPEADFRTVESAAGQVWGFMGQVKEIASLGWDAVPRARASRANETTGNESFQRFLEDGVWGMASWGTPAGPVRFFPDASGSSYVKYYVTSDLSEFKPEQFADGWAGGPWKCRLPRMVVIESGQAGRDTIAMTHVESSQSGTDGTSFVTTSFTVDPGDLVLIGICCSQTSTDAPPPTGVKETGAGTNLVCTQVDQIDWDVVNPAHNLSLWRAIPAAPHSGTVTITFGATVTACAWTIVKVSGVDQSGTNGSGACGQQAPQKGSALAATALPLTLAALENANNRAFVVYANDDDTVAFTPAPGFTEHGEAQTGSPDTKIESQSALALTACNVSTASPVTIGGIAIELKAGTL